MTNWKTTLSSTGAAIMSLLTIVSIAPYELEGIGSLIPPKYKSELAIASAVAALILKVVNGTWQKDKDVAGGSRSNPSNPTP